MSCANDGGIPLSLVVTLAAFAVALGILIAIHELGHYFVARIAGVRVVRFSLGFGPPLLTLRRGSDQTEWVLSALPFGGYVKMLDEREGPVADSERHRAFNTQPVHKRVAIVAAGPIANLLLAVVLYFFLFLSGVQDLRPKLGAPVPQTPAHSAGIARGDLIVKINGASVRGWQEARWLLMRHALERDPIVLEVVDTASHLSWKRLELRDFDADGFSDDPVARLGLTLYRPDPIIGRTLPGSVAEKAGLRDGDRVTSIDGKDIVQWDELVAAVRAAPGGTIRLTLERDNLLRYADITPETVFDSNGRRFGRIGAEPLMRGGEASGMLITVNYAPAESLRLALAKTWDTSVFSLRMIWKMLQGEVSLRNLSGPVTIADYAGQSARAGTASYILFVALISISLGVLNLLPIPVLDGGHLMYYLIEGVKGSPVSEKAMEIGQRVGVSVLVVLMAFAFFNDINRLISS